MTAGLPRRLRAEVPQPWLICPHPPGGSAVTPVAGVPPAPAARAPAPPSQHGLWGLHYRPGFQCLSSSVQQFEGKGQESMAQLSREPGLGQGFTPWQLPSCNKTKTDTGHEQAPTHQHREAGRLEGGAGKRCTEEKAEACMDAGTKPSETSQEKLKNQGSESSSACGPWRG